LLEAAACGTPFVASKVGGIPEIAHLGASRLVPPGDPELLAGAIRATIEDPPRRSVPGAAGMRSVADAVSELVELFEQIIRSHGRTLTVSACGHRQERSS
jgi:glycosyltransferase involved in cell wall biosynthesis